jgi:rubrerythrin
METGVLNCFPSLPFTNAARIEELEYSLSQKTRSLQHADRILKQERKDHHLRLEELEKLKQTIKRLNRVFEHQYHQIEALKRELSDTQEKLENSVNLQLPSAEPDTKNNRAFIRNNRQSQCAVCLQELINSENGLISVTPCGHRFHITCIERWLDTHSPKKCPTCREPIDSQSLTFQTAWDNNKKLYSCFNVKLT